MACACEYDITDLQCMVEKRIADLACKKLDLQKIGRDVSKYDFYLKLMSNLLFWICWIGCNEDDWACADLFCLRNYLMDSKI